MGHLLRPLPRSVNPCPPRLSEWTMVDRHTLRHCHINKDTYKPRGPSHWEDRCPQCGIEPPQDLSIIYTEEEVFTCMGQRGFKNHICGVHFENQGCKQIFENGGLKGSCCIFVSDMRSNNIMSLAGLFFCAFKTWFAPGLHVK